MSYEMVVGLCIANEEEYAKYRKAMTPILASFDGGFRYDFKVSEVLKSQTKDPINRVFTIHFGSKIKMEAFFSNTEYLKVKERYFQGSVSSTTIISEYEFSNSPS